MLTTDSLAVQDGISVTAGGCAAGTGLRFAAAADFQPIMKERLAVPGCSPYKREPFRPHASNPLATPAARMSETLELTQNLMARRSVTPADEGCQQVMTERLAALGFAIEPLRFGNVENFWARHVQQRSGLVLRRTHGCGADRRSKSGAGPVRRRSATECSTLPKRRGSIAKPRAARRSVMTCWQPSSAGVTERRAIRFCVSSRVSDIRAAGVAKGFEHEGETARVYTASSQAQQAVPSLSAESRCGRESQASSGGTTPAVTLMPS